MAWFSRVFGRSGKTKKDYPNITRGKDPLELWNKTGELGDGAFGKVFKVGMFCRTKHACTLVKWCIKQTTVASTCSNRRGCDQTQLSNESNLENLAAYVHPLYTPLTCSRSGSFLCACVV